MIILLKENANARQVDNLKKFLTNRGFDLHISEGTQHTLIGLIGDTSKLDIDLISSLDVVESVRRIQEPYKNANRKFHTADTVVDVGGAKIGGGHFMMIAGPCSVETHDQILSVAESAKASGANMLRGGAFKPRTSPYAFQGLHEKGIELLREAKKQTGLPIITEIMDINHLPLFEDVDVIQVGARNMQNFELLKELGKTNTPILLKRGFANTLEEFLMSAEYIMAGGNDQVILCERGIRTYETYTRNTLDISAVPALKRLSHLPVVVDPSHAAGIYWMVEPLAMSAVAAGADGLIIEVHNDPAHALSDGAQSLTYKHFARTMDKVRAVAAAVGREV